MIWANRQAKSAHGSKVGQSEPFEDDVTKKLKILKEQNKHNPPQQQLWIYKFWHDQLNCTHGTLPVIKL